jgi:hypothetical protein
MKSIIVSIVATILLATTAPAQTPAPYTIAVSLFNDAHVPPRVLDHAEQSASRIFAQSGIQLIWMLCGREEETIEERFDCTQTLYPEHFDVRIVNSSSHVGSDVFGISYLSVDDAGSQADVFYSKIVRFHHVSRTNPATLLGYAIAHELGHLLLGSNSHSLTGLMCGNWHNEELARMEQGGLLFGEEQSRRMKAKLSTYGMRKGPNPQAVHSATNVRAFQTNLAVSPD